MAHGLTNPKATRCGDLHDISYIEIDENTMWVVSRQPDYDNCQKMTAEEARAHYRNARDVLGFITSENPQYDTVTVDKFNRPTAWYYTPAPVATVEVDEEHTMTIDSADRVKIYKGKVCPSKKIVWGKWEGGKIEKPRSSGRTHYTSWHTEMAHKDLIHLAEQAGQTAGW